MNKKTYYLKRILTTLLLSLLSVQAAYAQSDSLQSLINDLSENETYLNDLLLELTENPVNINTADHNTLLSIPLLSHELADNIIRERKKIGRFKNKRQIRKIISPAIYNLIKDFISTSGQRPYNLKITQRNILKVEKVPEIESGKYKGNSLNNYTRFKYKNNSNFEIGFITQKDPGELSYTDHVNFSAQYTKKQWNILSGDYYVQFGKGLSQSNPYGNQKSIFLSAVFRQPSKVARQNLSSSESTGKRGLFVQKTFNNLDIFSFYSKAGRDVTMEDGSITGFKYDGFHRSSEEINIKNKINETSWGTGFYYTFFNSFKIGALYNDYTFDKNIENSFSVLGDQKRRQYFDFSGNKVSQTALSYNLKLNNLMLSGEFSQASQGGPGWTQSVYFTKDKFNIGVNYWYLTKDFISIDGRSFDNSNAFPQGVSGYFAGIQFKLTQDFSFGAFKKYEQQLWRSYFEPMPSERNEWLAQLDWKNQSVSATARFRDKESESFEEVENKSQRISQNQKFIRLELRYNPSKKSRLKTRWEHTFFERLDEKGTLFFQDFEYSLSNKINLSTRITFFNTSSFNSRIYEYERDVPGTFANIALFENGSKSYLLLKWKVLQNFQLWLKGRYIVKYGSSVKGDYNRSLNRDIRTQFVLYF